MVFEKILIIFAILIGVLFVGGTVFGIIVSIKEKDYFSLIGGVMLFLLCLIAVIILINTTTTPVILI